MTDKELELINKLSEVVAGSTGHVLDAYTYYYVMASIVWGIFGVVALWCGFAMRKRTLAIPDEETDGPRYILGAYVVPGILILIGALMVANNVSDLLTPRAMAIHQLLKDIRGE